jgi:hypothetical protein
MTDVKQRGRQPGVEDLELTRETVQDLTESEAEAVEGGQTGACLEIGVREPIAAESIGGCALRPPVGQHYQSAGCGG